MNIAEGCGRNSNKELVHFLYIGIGSASEVEYTLLLCHDLNYIDNEKYLELSLLLDEIKKMLYSLIKTIKPSTN